MCFFPTFVATNYFFQFFSSPPPQISNGASLTGSHALCDIIFWNSPCVFAMQCGKNRTLFDFLPARQITRAGSACMEMIHGFKEGWIISEYGTRAGPPARVKLYQWKRALNMLKDSMGQELPSAWRIIMYYIS